jgi:hypothetical protein
MEALWHVGGGGRRQLYGLIGPKGVLLKHERREEGWGTNLLDLDTRYRIPSCS